MRLPHWDPCSNSQWHWAKHIHCCWCCTMHKALKQWHRQPILQFDNPELGPHRHECIMWADGGYPQGCLCGNISGRWPSPTCVNLKQGEAVQCWSKYPQLLQWPWACCPILEKKVLNQGVADRHHTKHKLPGLCPLDAIGPWFYRQAWPSMQQHPACESNWWEPWEWLEFLD